MLIQALESKNCVFFNLVLPEGGTLPLFNVVYVDDNIAVENSTWVSCQ